MHKTLPFLTTAAIILAGLMTLTPVQAADEADRTAPAFTLKDHNGKDVSLADFDQDTIVVLEWINFRCPFVVRHHSDKYETMVNLAKAYQDKNVVWLAINSTHSATVQKNKADAETNQLPYAILDDHTGQVGTAYGARTTPDMRVIQGGRILYAGAIDNDPRGKLPESDRINYVKQAIDEILAGTPVSVPQTKPYGCSVKYAR